MQDVADETRRPSSVRRVPADGYQTGEQVMMVKQMGGPVGQRASSQGASNTIQQTRVRRASLPTPDTRSTSQRYRADVEAEPVTRPTPTNMTPRLRAGTRPQRAPQQQLRGSERHFLRWPAHPLLSVVATLLAVVLFWLFSTVGMAWFTTTFCDPGTYGPTHGTVATAILGGGDSQAHPSKIIAMNNAGRVELIVLIANDPMKAHIVLGPDLATWGFPDPTDAKIAVEIGDYNHDGHIDVKVIMSGTFYDWPFHRYSQNYILYGDGKGDLKPLQQ